MGRRPGCELARGWPLTIADSATQTAADRIFGGPGDVPVPGDCDGVAERALFRASDHTWYIDRVGSHMWGALGDVPLPADYDGDGKRDMAVFRPSDGTWYIVYSGTQTGAAFTYGGPGDIPVEATPRNP